MSGVILRQGDCREVLSRCKDNCVDAVVTDPPYGLSKEPNIAEVLKHWLAGDDYQHKGGGFMGKTWDSFVPGPCTWKEVFRVLKPGGHLLCFAGSRTVDLMGISLRMAGFEIRDSLAWIKGTGKPASPNHLRPTLEPILLARRSGGGDLQIDACRVPRQTGDRFDYGLDGDEPSQPHKNVYGAPSPRTAYEPHKDGRWPGRTICTDVDEKWAKYFYAARVSAKERGDCTHPTMKPLALMRYLCRLVTPPNGLILDPFMGSGSTGKAARLEGFRFFGITDEQPHLEIAQRRIKEVL